MMQIYLLLPKIFHLLVLGHISSCMDRQRDVFRCKASKRQLFIVSTFKTYLTCKNITATLVRQTLQLHCNRTKFWNPKVNLCDWQYSSATSRSAAVLCDLSKLLLP